MQATSNFNTPRPNGQPSKILTFDNIFRAVVIALVGIVGIVALVMSYDALYLMASKHGHDGWKAYIWPTLIDLPLVVFTLVMLYAQIRRMGGWTIAGLLGLVLAYTGVTVYLNYLESDGSIEGVFVRVSAPLGLFVCTEVLRHLLKFEIERKSKVASIAELTQMVNTNRQEVNTLVNHLDNLAVERDNLQAEIEQLKVNKDVLNFEENYPKVETLNDARQAKKQERVDTLLTYLIDNPQANLTDAADYVGVSRQTVGKYVNELTEDGKLHRNGNGWEVVR